MTKTHLGSNGRLLCGRRIDRFAHCDPAPADSPITCHLCRLAGKHLDGTPFRAETCDACGTGRTTIREFCSLPDRFNPDQSHYWLVWTACDQHGHGPWDLPRLRTLLSETLDLLTDDQYLAARGDEERKAA